MIWGETYEQEANRMTTPTRWFAWYPVTLPDGRSVWLEYVLRYRRDYRGGVVPQSLSMGPYSSFWTYIR